MRLQTHPGRCGPAALGNALRALGRPCPREAVLAVACGTWEGTDEHGIIRGARSRGLGVTTIETPSRREAWQALAGALLVGRPVVAHLPRLDHWVACVGLLGADRVIVVDSTNTIENTREQGTRVYPRRAWLNAWGKGLGNYYGIALG